MKYKTTDDEKHKSDDDHAEKDGHDAAHPAEDHSDGAHGNEHAGEAHDAHGHGHEEIAAEDWTIQNSMDYYLDPGHLIAHVQDSDHFEMPSFLAGTFDYEAKEDLNIKIPRMSPWSAEKPLVGEGGTIQFTPNQFIGPIDFQPTKFVILELIGALIVCAVFIPYARRIKNGDRPKGRFWNMIDTMVCYVRDEIAVPSIGSADAKRFFPFIWTIFFFVLTLNLIGMVPGLGAATGSISVTAALALAVFFVVMATGMKKMGVAGFLKAQAPHLDISPTLKIFLVPMIWAIEVFGLFIKHAVLAVRLFANMFAGHLVVGVFVAFIGVTWGTWLAYPAAPMVILASIAVNLLELLVAFIQAYVFAFLASLFIGAAIHPH